MRSLLEHRVSSSKGVLAENSLWAWGAGDMAREQHRLLLRLLRLLLGRPPSGCGGPFGSVFLHCLPCRAGGCLVLTQRSHALRLGHGAGLCFIPAPGAFCSVGTWKWEGGEIAGR